MPFPGSDKDRWLEAQLTPEQEKLVESAKALKLNAHRVNKKKRYHFGVIKWDPSMYKAFRLVLQKDGLNIARFVKMLAAAYLHRDQRVLDVLRDVAENKLVQKRDTKTGTKALPPPESERDDIFDAIEQDLADKDIHL